MNRNVLINAQMGDKLLFKNGQMGIFVEGSNGEYEILRPYDIIPFPYNCMGEPKDGDMDWEVVSTYRKIPQDKLKEKAVTYLREMYGLNEGEDLDFQSVVGVFCDAFQKGFNFKGR